MIFLLLKHTEIQRNELEKNWKTESQQQQIICGIVTELKSCHFKIKLSQAENITNLTKINLDSLLFIDRID